MAMPNDPRPHRIQAGCACADARDTCAIACLDEADPAPLSHAGRSGESPSISVG